MLRLTVVRHARAEEAHPSGKDYERRLKRRGLDEALRSAQRLAELGLIPDLIIASPAQRARQTAELLHADSLSSSRLQFEERLYQATAAELLTLIRATDPAVLHLLLVGHNPGVTELCRLLGGDRMLQELTTAAFYSMTLEATGWAEVRGGAARELQREAPAG